MKKLNFTTGGRKMHFKWITIPNTDFKFVEYTITKDDAIYKNSFLKALELAPQMNKHAPDGTVRSDEEIFANCFAGCIAENAVIYRVNEFAIFKNKNNVTAEATSFDKNVDDDQVDVVVKGENAKYTIEVRSSYGKVQNNVRRYKEWFSIVGNYVSANKGRELQKDYYITVIFNFSQETMLEKIKTKESISFQIAAGCDKEFLQKYGKIDDLKNDGATYKVIKPLINGKTVNAVMSDMFRKL